ncbi:MAG: CinA family protein, partial [Crocinitomicaceae bacterium]|nr:CinA family protein [Crocinitomicaceae bacterium]
DDKDKIADYIERISLRLPQYVFGNGENSLSKVVGDLLIKEDLTLGTVESCTGGAMANEIVSIAGASQYFRGSFVSYANEIKTSLVGINKDDINKHGAVSETIVKQMAQNGREKLNVDYCLSTSGIAGPNGGTEQKPVGLVWIGMAGPSGVVAKKFQFGNARDRNVRRTILTALNLLRCDLLKINIEKS